MSGGAAESRTGDGRREIKKKSRRCRPCRGRLIAARSSGACVRACKVVQQFTDEPARRKRAPELRQMPQRAARSPSPAGAPAMDWYHLVLLAGLQPPEMPRPQLERLALFDHVAVSIVVPLLDSAEPV